MPYGAIIGGALGLMGSAMQSGTSYASALQQQQAQKEAFQNRYQWSRADLEKAGYNPMLLASQGPGSVGNMAQAQIPDLASAMQVASQIRLQNSQADLNANSAREAGINADIAEKTKEQMDANPGLYQTAAETKSGINSSSAIGIGRGLFERGRNFLSGASSALDVNDLGPRGSVSPNVQYYDRQSKSWKSAKVP